MYHFLPTVFQYITKSFTVTLAHVLVSVLAFYATPANADADINANAYDLQCKLAENITLTPVVMSSLATAANNGYLYRVEARNSSVTFKVNHFPFSTVEGSFNEFDGGFALPEKMLSSENKILSRQALFIINVHSITTGDVDMNAYLKSSVFFNAEQFPVIIFVSTKFEWIDHSTAKLFGNLTMHGTTRPLTFNIRLDTSDRHASNEKITMLANAQIQRSDFGMHGLQTLVSDKVDFNLKIQALRPPG